MRITAMQLNDAILTGEVEAVQRAMAAGVDLNQPSATDEMTPLMVAAEQGHIEIVNLLIRAGADVNLPDRHNHTALTKLNAVRGLLRSGADPNLVWAEYDSLDGHLIPGTTPLMYAGATGRIKLVRLLLRAGALIFPPWLKPWSRPVPIWTPAMRTAARP